MASSRFLLSAIAIALMVAGAAAQGKTLGEPRERVGGRQERERGEKLLAAASAATLFFAGYIPLGFVSAGEIKKYSLFALSLPPFNNFPSGMQAADARSECTVIAARMQTGPCAKLQDATMVSRWRFLREREVSPLGSFFRRRRRCFFSRSLALFFSLFFFFFPSLLSPPVPENKRLRDCPSFVPRPFSHSRPPPPSLERLERKRPPPLSHTLCLSFPPRPPQNKKTRTPPHHHQTTNQTKKTHPQQKHTAEIEAMDCPALNVFKETMPTADDSCCDDLRAFITVGCSCDPDVLDLISLSGATKANLAAALKMAQSGQCADPAHGGPMVNPCDGTVGCPPAV